MSHVVSSQLKDEYATLVLGANIGRLLTSYVEKQLGRALCVFLEGDLGAGKTTLTRGLLRASRKLGVIKSPTYSIVETYHIDACAESKTISLCTLDDLDMAGLLDNPQQTPQTASITAKLPFEIAHFDLYRITSSEELEMLGIRDYFARSGICLVEWPDRGMELLPKPDLTVVLEHCPHGRKLTLSSEMFSEEELKQVAAV